MSRELKHSTKSNKSLLKANQDHLFAMKYSLRIYKPNAIYTFIPKNACSTLRLSLAIENGCLADANNFNWIHDNNETFMADLPSLISASYSFVVLRCPFARLASAYLDKIAGLTVEGWNFHKLIDRSMALNEVTFRDFIYALKKTPVRNGDPHWRSQSDFLVYKEYDDYFSIEDFETLVATLKSKINFTVTDARKLTQHGLTELELLNIADAASLASLDIQLLKRSNQCPTHRSLYDDELISIVTNIYAQDIALYKNFFGEKNLMFHGPS